MRSEKKYLVEELNQHLDKSNYIYLTNYERVTVEEIAKLRLSLAEHNAEFHVVKNSILGIAVEEKSLPNLDEHLNGQTAIVIGGENPSGVAKVIDEFFKKNNKVIIKGGVLNEKTLSREEIEKLAKLPGLQELQSQLLSVLMQPGNSFVQILSAVPRNIVNVLQAKLRKMDDN